MRIKKGDYVQAITGDDTGKRGRVLRVSPTTQKIVVEGINYIYKHLKRGPQHTQGGRIQKEAPLAIANVMLYCPHCQKPTHSGRRYETPQQTAGEGKEEKKEVKGSRNKIRYCKQCQRIV